MYALATLIDNKIDGNINHDYQLWMKEAINITLTIPITALNVITIVHLVS